jgi:hypothetical protein
VPALEKKEPATHLPTTQYLTYQMALFAAIGDRFIAKILKQIASDYNLDYEDMKTRYCGDTSFELSISTKELKKNQLTVDLEAPAPDKAVKIPKPKAPKVPKAVDPDAPPKAPKVPKPKAPDEPKGPAPMALSKMKKPDLVQECEERGLDSEGTVAQLKERVKDARAASGEKKPARKKAEPKPKAAPPPPPVPLEEEDGEEDEDLKELLNLNAFKEIEEEEEEEEHDDLQARLRKILAEAEEDEFEEEDEDDQELEEELEEELED